MNVASFAAFEDTVVLAVCELPTAEDDPCELSARDSRSGEVRWAVEIKSGPTILPAPAASIAIPMGPPPPDHLLIESRISGARHYSLFDLETGDRLSEHTDLDVRFSDDIGVSDGMLIAQTVIGREEGGRCRAELTAFPVDSVEPAWTKSVAVADGDGEQCQSVATLTSRDGTLAFSDDGGPILIDVHSGEHLWEGTEPGIVRAFAGGIVVVYSAVSTDSRFGVWETEFDRVQWEPYEAVSAWPGGGSSVWVAARAPIGDCGEVFVYNHMGTQCLPGRLAYRLPGQVVTEAEGEWRAWSTY